MPDFVRTIAACASARWSPAIGDPTPMGWATVAAYFAAAFLALLVLIRTGATPARLERRERAFWFMVLAAMLALGVNKELDLQSLLTALGRCLAFEGGWYEARRPVQAAFIGAILAGGAALLVVLARLLRGTLRRNGIALLGLVVLGVFVGVRAAGFHHVDALISWRVGGWRMNWILELGGIALVALGALRVLLGGGPFRRDDRPERDRRRVAPSSR